MTRHTLTALAFSALVACEAPPTAPARGGLAVADPSFALIARERIVPYVQELVNPCNGEFVLTESAYQMIMTETLSKGGNLQHNVHITIHGDGVGETGARYVFKGSFNTLARQFDTDLFVGQDVGRIYYIRQGGSDEPDNFVHTGDVRVVANLATGEVDWVWEKVSLECRGHGVVPTVHR